MKHDKSSEIGTMSGGAAANRPFAPTQQQLRLQIDRRQGIRQIRRRIEAAIARRAEIHEYFDDYRTLVTDFHVRLTDAELRRIRTQIERIGHNHVRLELQSLFIFYLLQDQRQILEHIIDLEREIVHITQDENRPAGNRYYAGIEFRYLERAARRIEDLDLRLHYLEYLRDRYFNLDTIPEAVLNAGYRPVIVAGRRQVQRHIARVRAMNDNVNESKRYLLHRTRYARDEDFRKSIGGQQHAKKAGSQATAARGGAAVDQRPAKAQQKTSQRASGGGGQAVQGPGQQIALRQPRSPLQQYLQHSRRHPRDPELQRNVAAAVTDSDVLTNDLFRQLMDALAQNKHQNKIGGAAQQKKGT